MNIYKEPRQINDFYHIVHFTQWVKLPQPNNVGNLLLKSFGANEMVFQLMMLAYTLFLLFKFDGLVSPEYRQQIKIFRLKYLFVAGRIIRTVRNTILKLAVDYPYKDVYLRYATSTFSNLTSYPF
jgi:hypothetical protein